jgi:hypothetical protein
MKETQEDSTTIKTYPTNIKLNNQAKKDDVCDYSGENRVCTHPIERQLVYVRVCQGKTHIYVLKHCQVKDKAKKFRLKMKKDCQAIRRQETQDKQEQSKEKNTPNPENKIPSPVWSSIILRGKSLYGMG